MLLTYADFAEINCSFLGTLFCCFQKSETNQEEDEEEKFENPKEVVTKQPRNYNEDQTFLCCSGTVREDQVDFCPQIWFKDLKKSPKSCEKFRRFLWRLCFLVTCLPLCYPCYLSRSMRRRLRQKRPRGLDETLQVNKDELNRTILRTQVTRNDTDDQSPSKVKKPLVISTNVIVLHSPASNILHQYFKNDFSSLEEEPQVSENSYNMTHEWGSEISLKRPEPDSTLD